MVSPPGPEPELRALVAQAWAFRWQVELDAAVRFEQLARRLAAVDASPTVVASLEKAAADELRHAEHCQRLAREYGSTFAAALPAAVEEIAPAHLSLEDRVL